MYTAPDYPQGVCHIRKAAELPTAVQCAARAALQAPDRQCWGARGAPLAFSWGSKGAILSRERMAPLSASPHGVGQSQLSNMYPRRFQHQLFGANGIKRHLKQRIAAHRGDGDDQSVTERLVVDVVAGGKLKQRRGGGGLLPAGPGSGPGGVSPQQHRRRRHAAPAGDQPGRRGHCLAGRQRQRRRAWDVPVCGGGGGRPLSGHDGDGVLTCQDLQNIQHTAPGADIIEDIKNRLCL